MTASKSITLKTILIEQDINPYVILTRNAFKQLVLIVSTFLLQLSTF